MGPDDARYELSGLGDVMELIVDGWRIAHLHYADRSEASGPPAACFDLTRGVDERLRRLRARRRARLLAPRAGGALPREPRRLEVPHPGRDRRPARGRRDAAGRVGRGARALPGRPDLRAGDPPGGRPGQPDPVRRRPRHRAGGPRAPRGRRAPALHVPRLLRAHPHRDVHPRRDRGRRRGAPLPGGRGGEPPRGQPAGGRAGRGADDPAGRTPPHREHRDGLGHPRGAGADPRPVGLPDPARARRDDPAGHRVARAAARSQGRARAGRRAPSAPRSRARSGPPSSATATGSSTPPRSGGSSTRPRSSSRRPATTTGRGSPTRSRCRPSRARSPGRWSSTRTSSRRSRWATTSGTRPSATPARWRSTASCRSRHGRRYEHNVQSLRIVEVLERGGGGPQPDRRRARRHPQPHRPRAGR